jgi:hypothetical protein
LQELHALLNVQPAACVDNQVAISNTIDINHESRTNTCSKSKAKEESGNDTGCSAVCVGDFDGGIDYGNVLYSLKRGSTDYKSTDLCRRGSGNSDAASCNTRVKSNSKFKPSGNGCGCGTDDGLDVEKRDNTSQHSKACTLERGRAGPGSEKEIVLEELLKLLADMNQVNTDKEAGWHSLPGIARANKAIVGSHI